MAYDDTVELKDTQYQVTVRDSAEVVGRAVIVVPETGVKTIRMRQTAGGGNQHVFQPPIEADIEVLRSFVKAADEIGL